ncbi:MAG: Dihydrolipoamide acetyltransferase component of pyruvate dehydrogenase complex [Gemmatimonadetes bacterium]|nr:Dihydrolipoamide acetyltransferase component of pyruvate dehydrogenase complex [Gemmatimonadota bacterium]
MVFPVRTPRVNNNDDVVRLSAVLADVGSQVREGDIVAEVETDKATFAVPAERAGYFLKCLHEIGETMAVGSILAWMGESADDAVPQESATAANARSAEPTLKAALLLREYGIDAAKVHASSDRLSAADVETYIALHGVRQPAAAVAAPAARVLPPPDVASSIQEMNVMERGMLRTVTWHRDEAVTGYVEIAYDTRAWDDYGAAFQKEHKLLLNPTMSLMAFQLVALRAKNVKFNATVHDDKKVLYQPVNVGFTVQSGDNLYLVVVANADQMTSKAFVSRLLALQKAAMKNRLEASETSGATIGFTSMARWGIMRHQPVLPPYTSLMVAHAAAVNGQSALGATYDHRILSGADVAAALHFLKDPPDA